MKIFIKKLKGNPKLFELVALLVMAIYFFVASYMTLKNNSPLIFILTFFILMIIILIFYFFVRNKFVKTFLLKCLIFPTMIILIMVFALFYFNYTEGGGQNYSPNEIKFDAYILDNITTIEKFNQDLIKANEIWNKYNITLKLEEVFFVNEINLSEKVFLLNVNATNEEECLKYNKIISFSNQSELRVIVFELESGHRGRGCICYCNSIILNVKKELSLDLTHWNLAHEFGHLFGLLDLRNRYNLMCDELKIIKPSFLNKGQVSSVKNAFSNPEENFG